MREFAMAMRRHRSAGVQVRVDERSEGPRALEPWIDVPPEFPREGQVRTLAGRDHDPVDRVELACTLLRLAGDDHLIAGFPHMRGIEARDQGDAPAFDQNSEARAEFAP